MDLKAAISSETAKQKQNGENESKPQAIESLHTTIETLQGKFHLTALSDNIVAPRGDGAPPHFSQSQMSTYLRCGKQYKYKYIQQIRGPGSLKMASGSAIHQALEYNSRFKLSTKDDMSMEQIVDAESDAHDKFMGTVEALEPKAVARDKDQSIGIVRLYRRVQASIIKPIAVEHPFRFELEDDDHDTGYLPVIGFIDSVSQVPDARPGPTKGRPVIALEDYKKVSQRKSQLEIDISPQLTLYDYVFNLETGMTTDVVGLRQLGFNGARAAEPGPYSTPAYRSPQMMQPERRKARWNRVLDQMRAVQRAIRKEVFIPTDDPRVCSWCDYQLICQDRVER